MLKNYKNNKSICRYSHTAGIMLSVFLFIIFCLLPAGAQASAESTGKFTYVKGRVDVLRGGKLPAEPVRVGTPVYVKDAVRTKSRSKARIRFNDGNIVSLAGRTRVDISDYVSESSGVLNLVRGKVRSVVSFLSKRISRSPTRFEVRTSNAIAGVRGTDYIVFYENAMTGVLVNKGTVETYNPQFPDDVVNITAGQITTVSKGKRPAPPRPATDSETDRHSGDTAPVDDDSDKKDDSTDTGDTDVKDDSTGDTDSGASDAGDTGSTEPGTADADSFATQVNAFSEMPPVPGDVLSPLTIATNPPDPIVPVSDPPPVSETQPEALTDTEPTPTTTGGTFITDQIFRSVSGTYYETEYAQTVSGIRYHYDAEYIQSPDGMGMGFADNGYAGFEMLYFPDGTSVKSDHDVTTKYSSWNITSIEELRPFPANSIWDPGSENFEINWYSEMAIDVLAQRPYDLFSGSFASTGYPWDSTAAPFTMGGTYSPYNGDYSKPDIYFSRLSGKFVTPAGTVNGAYIADTGGFLSAVRGAKGLFYGIYIGQDNTKAGVFKGLYEGSLSTSNGTWNTSGTLSSTVCNDNFAANAYGITQANLNSNVMEGSLFTWLDGSFTNNGSPVAGSFIGSMDMYGKTLSIKGENWGIYQIPIWVGGYGIPAAGYTDFTVYASGWGEIGYYKDSSNTWQPDFGYWFVPINGTANNGVITGSGNGGKFITKTKLGNISADLLGIGNTLANPDTFYSWQGDLAGAWEAEASLTFFSKFDTKTRRYKSQYNASYYESPTRHYWYWYSNNDKEGTIYFHDGTILKKREYNLDEGPLGKAMWTEFSYNTSSEQWVAYSTGTDYPSTFNDTFFNNLAGQMGFPSTASTHSYYYDYWDSIVAYMGGTGDLWSATSGSPAAFYLGGEYENDQYKPTVFAAYIDSYNAINGTHTTLDGKGAYKGFVSGYTIDDSVTGIIYATFVYKEGTQNKAGILIGSFAGTAYKDPEAWYGEGGLYPVYIDNTTIAPESLMGNIWESTDIVSGTGYFKIQGGPAEPVVNTGMPPSFDEAKSIYFYSGSRLWQINYSLSGGAYNGINYTDSWTSSTLLESNSLYYSPAAPDVRVIAGNDTIGSKWSDNEIKGKYYGYVAAYEPGDYPFTVIQVGNVRGTFDPTNYTCQTVAMGIGFETSAFLTMAADMTPGGGNDKLKQLGIPSVEVGNATMTGSGNNMNITMEKVAFFASNSGEPPKIWACGNGTDSYVMGTYTAAPVIGTGIPISGGGLTATFTPKVWDTTNKVWMSTIDNGTGGFNGSTSFRGAGAGKIDSPSSGVITGTASGTAK